MDIIWIRGKPFHYYDEYKTWKEAQDIAKKYKQIKNNDYYILIGTRGVFPKKKYYLYMTKIQRILT